MSRKLKSQNSKVKTTIQKLKFYVLSFSSAFFILGFTFTCLAQTISSSELINNARAYDGKSVVYTGEVIGDIMLRGDNAWINVNDADNAIGIWIKASLVKDIAYTGSYKSKGDVLEITGVFQRSCPQHGGDLDIHALATKRITPGRKLTERFNFGKRNLIFVLLAILGLVWILRLLKRR